MFTVEEIIQATSGRLIQGNRLDKIGGISTDSRGLKSQEAFLALKGNNFDGHNFIPSVLKSGAVCIIAEKSIGLKIPKDIAFIKVKNSSHTGGLYGKSTGSHRAVQPGSAVR